ncbi:MAG: repressor LexA [Chloroflexi bacterium]|nr:repressor LexA [Chloroflexota bacterium]MYK62560.1 repressor LexA [Chloroflexota bacterium]
MPKPRAKTREVRRRIWEFIRDYRRENLYGPNLREIAEAVGISSASNVNYHVKPMIEQGLLSGNSNARSLNVQSGIPIVGMVGAGPTVVLPDPKAVEWDQVSEFDTIDFPDWLVGNARDPFALEVTGDSMIDAGIMEDDIIIMEKTNRAKRGDMVIAYVSSREEHTVKRYYPNGPTVTLQPDNKNYDPLIEDSKDVSIEGKVIGVVRRY